MIVCSCNAFSDCDVQTAVANAARRVSEVYTSIGCTPQCGQCARTVERILDEGITPRGSDAPSREARPTWTHHAPDGDEIRLSRPSLSITVPWHSPDAR